MMSNVYLFVEYCETTDRKACCNSVSNEEDGPDTAAVDEGDDEAEEEATGAEEGASIDAV